MTAKFPPRLLSWCLVSLTGIITRWGRPVTDLEPRPDAPAATEDQGQAGATASVTPETHAQASSRPQLQVGDLIAERFKVLRFIARGGMGEVYEAQDTLLGVHVALKLVASELGDHPEALERFRREVLLARRVSHRNVCRMFEFYSVEHHGVPLRFLTMEFLDGVALSDTLARQGRLSPSEALPILQQVAAALHAAHREGIVHRDLKPANVMLVRDADHPELRVVVTDFGIARALPSPAGKERAEATATHGWIGTPQYMAPEQLRSEAPTPATDIYALGVLAYRMVTGRLPFEGDTPWAAAVERVDHRPMAPRDLLAGCPIPWNQAILRALEPAPERRFSTAAAFVEALSAASRWEWKRPIAVAVALAAMVVVGLFVARLRQRPPAAPNIRPSVAVVHIAYQGGTETAWVAPGLALMLEREIEAAESSVRVVPWHRVAMARASLGIDPTRVLSVSDAERLKSLLAVSRAISATIRCTAGAGEPTCELSLPELSVQEQFPVSGAIAASAQAGEHIRKALGVDLEQGEMDWLVARRPTDISLLRALAQAMVAYERFDLPRVAEELEAIGKLYPQSFDSHEIRSLALQRLALFTQAQRAAKSAQEVSAKLAPWLQRRAAARVDWLGTDRERAVAAYRALHRDYPDDLELALELSARLPSGACLALLDELVKIPGPSASDLRVAIRRADCLLVRSRSETEGVIQAAAARATTLGARRELAALEDLRAAFLSRGPARPEVIVGALRHSVELSLLVGELSRAAITRMDFHSSGAIRTDEEDLRAVVELRGVRDRARVAQMLRSLAIVRATSGLDTAAALRTLEEAEREFRALEEQPDWYSEYVRAWILEAAGAAREARRAFDRARELPVTGFQPVSYDIPSNVADDDPSTVRGFMDSLEMELLVTEDRLDEASALAEAGLRKTDDEQAPTWVHTEVCVLKCLQRWDEDARSCLSRLTPDDLVPARTEQGAVLRCRLMRHRVDSIHAAFAASS